MDEIDELLSIRAAELYYEENKTQDEIGQALRLTRWKVGRLLAQAKQRGFIRIEILHSARASAADRASAPRRARAHRRDRRLRAGRPSAEELQQRTPRRPPTTSPHSGRVPRTLGVSWGRTLFDISQHLRNGWASGVNVVQINGGVSLNRRARHRSGHRGRHRAEGRGQRHSAAEPRDPRAPRDQRGHRVRPRRRRGHRLARSADAYLFSAGAADHNSVHVESGYLAGRRRRARAEGRRRRCRRALHRLRRQHRRPALDARTVGISLDDLRRAPLGIAVVAGPAKHAVADAVVRSGLCSVLVTDESTALHLLDG